MTDPRNGALRLVRGGLVNAGIFALGCGAHFLGGGDLPEPLILAALAIFFQLICTAVARWSSFAVLVPVMAGGQFVLHHAFEMTTAASGCPSLGHIGHHAGHHAPLSLPEGCPTHSHGGHGDALMLATHALATVLGALLLRHGDRALLSLLSFVAPRLAIVVLTPAPWPERAEPGPIPAADRADTPTCRIDVETVSRRGPPDWLLAA